MSNNILNAVTEFDEEQRAKRRTKKERERAKNSKKKNSKTEKKKKKKNDEKIDDQIKNNTNDDDDDDDQIDDDQINNDQGDDDDDDESSSAEGLVLGSEDKFPILSYVVVRANVPALYSELQLIRDFAHRTQLREEAGFRLVELEQAVEYVNTLDW